MFHEWAGVKGGPTQTCACFRTLSDTLKQHCTPLAAHTSAVCKLARWKMKLLVTRVHAGRMTDISSPFAEDSV